MHTLKAGIGIAWIIFWAYWLVAAFGAKKGTVNRRRIPFAVLTGVSIALLLRTFRSGNLAVHSLALGALGAVLVGCGIAIAVWARIHLGRNWGMPTTEKAEPELVTSGPYRFIRHPIYSGLALGLLGTVLATNLIGLIMVAILGAYFYYSASVEENNLIRTFPRDYPAYRARTKMLIPFLL